ncbi:MAG: type II secretion system minor pseudopilin GspK [Desulfobacteraceae bacterium]|nr:type II secretion system minor pseudopilin GspK [Desulfobacteraceae bacterium]
MRRRFKDCRGFALLLTVLIISLIVTLTLQFNTSMRSELYAAANMRDNTRLSAIAKSAFHYALAVLLEDASETTFDSLREAWADPVTLSANSDAMFEEGRFEVQIIDHSGRIQINKLVQLEGKEKGKYNKGQKDLLRRFLGSEQFDLDPEEIDNLIDAIKDWIDPDNEATKFGAESSYYQTLQRPYSCKNAALEFLEELLLIRGITKELFYGTREKPGIANYLSTQGDGRININTADPMVLRSLSEHLDQEMVEEMIVYRENEKNDLSQRGWYKKVRGMSSEVSIDGLITTSSTHFEIRSVGLKDTMSKGVRGLVERKEGALRILSWRVD